MAEYPLIIVRGGGDIATGTIQKLFRAGFKVLVLEAAQPTAIRRNVALCDAVYDGVAQVEDMVCRLVATDDQMKACHKNREIPLMVDPGGACIKQLKPRTLVDAILAKHNCGTSMGMAPVTIALGPGFEAGADVHAVVETMRGHNLGRLLLQGCALPDTGTPGLVGGESLLRVMHAPHGGLVRQIKHIGDVVHKGEPIMLVNQTFVTTEITGRLRGIIRNGLYVAEGMKIADVDPRLDTDWNTISDKARCIGGAVLEAHMMLTKQLRAKK